MPNAAQCLKTESLYAERFQLVKMLGEGTVGRVYLAEDSVRRELIGLRILHDDIARELGGLSGVTEVLRKVCRLGHPNLVRAYDFNEHAGEIFLSSQYFPGKTLRQTLEAEGILAREECHRLVLEIAAALEHASTVLPHLNLKPENIFFETGESPIVSDCGLACLLPLEKLKTCAALDNASVYQPPEFFEAHGEPDCRSDQYSLGVIWLETLTGKQNPRGKEAQQALQKLPAESAQILKKMLAPNPEDRFPNWRLMREQLESLLNKRNRIGGVSWSSLVEKIAPSRQVALGMAILIPVCAILVFAFHSSFKSKAMSESAINLVEEWQAYNARRLALLKLTTQDETLRESLFENFDPKRELDWLDELFRLKSGLHADSRSSRQSEMNALGYRLQQFEERLRSAESAHAALASLRALMSEMPSTMLDSGQIEQWNEKFSELRKDFIRGVYAASHAEGVRLAKEINALFNARWQRMSAALNAAQSDWQAYLDRWNLGYLEPNEDLGAWLKRANESKTNGRWTHAFEELNYVIERLQAWVDETSAIPSLRASEWENSLGMRFVPVDRMLVSVWETRIQDYACFIHRTGKDHRFMWRREAKNQGGPTHPVVSVTRLDAEEFCAWLTERERGLGFIEADQMYRLPTDAEWSRFAGLPKEPGNWPVERMLMQWDIFPWGDEPVRPQDGGNYWTWPNATEDNNYHGFMDPYHLTSPAGRFPPNAFGLYDIGGNVWEYTSDWIDEFYAATKNVNELVSRGGGYRNVSLDNMRLTARLSRRYDDLDLGFRCVLVKTP